jgi:hypothetical protein
MITYHFKDKDKPDCIDQHNMGEGFGVHFWPSWKTDIISLNRSYCVAIWRVRYKSKWKLVLKRL